MRRAGGLAAALRRPPRHGGRGGVVNTPLLFTSPSRDLSAPVVAMNRSGREGPSNLAHLKTFPAFARPGTRRARAAQRFPFDIHSANAIACLTTFIQA
jgi:hypothetical protein